MKRIKSLYIAQQLYGDIWFKKPIYTKENCCYWCNSPVSGRRKSFCSDEHSRKFNDLTVFKNGLSSYTTRILYRDNFTCQECGEFHAYKNNFGVYIPVGNGNLAVHHIIPIECGGDCNPNNLITLCIKCHKLKHKKE